MTDGEMLKPKIKLIAAWAEIHKDELLANWELAIEEPLRRSISPNKGGKIMPNPIWHVTEVEPLQDALNV